VDAITFVGTATTLIRLGSFTLLTDPNFLHRGQRAYLGKGLWSRRLTEPAMQPADLPALDAVLLSHLHGDHFDRVARRTLDRSTVVVTTPEAADRLSGWGFTTRPLETWEVVTLAERQEGESLTVESLPAIHATGVMARLLPPVMGMLLEHRADGRVRRVLLSGDTLTGDHVDAIAARHPAIDVAVVHLGGTRVLFRTVTMDAGQGVDYVRRLRPGTVVPVHYDDYTVFRSPVADFLAHAAAACLPTTVQVPSRGETVSLPAPAIG
jgi:L-ascorbate metabolism protein UlaG (beta-lactamase superfamily)